MCAVSMIGDYFSQKWSQPNNHWAPNNGPTHTWGFGSFTNPPTREEFDQLKKEVLEMKELLLKAKEYDKKNNQPDCEMEDKVRVLRKVAEAVGVDLDSIFGDKNK